MTARPLLTLQTGTLYASGDDSTFTGTGGPWGYSPWTSQFGGVVSSAGLDGEPFSDTVFDVAAGDEVTFVIAVQNRASAAPAYDVHVKATIPTGFVTPPEGMNVTVIDGTGSDLPNSGDLFSAAGLSIGPALTGYDPASGLNVALVTYTLQAGPGLPAVNASVVSTASVVHVAASAGGADLSATGPVSASTMIVTAAPMPMVQAETDPSAVAAGQTIAFDVTVAVPNGSLHDLRLDTILPGGTANLTFVSASVVSEGSGLQASTPSILANGEVQLGTVTNTGSGTTPASQSITVRVLARAGGSGSGVATLETVLSAADPGSPGGRWSATVDSSVGVVAPPAAPRIGDTSTAQHATVGSIAYPFAGLTLSSSATNPSGTLAITVQDGTLGRLAGTALGSFSADGSSFVATGTIAALQAAARQIVFKAGQVGTERFTVTLVDAQGGTAQDGSTTAAVTAASSGLQGPQPFAPAIASAGSGPAGSVSYVQGQVSSNAAGALAIVTAATTGSTPSFASAAAAQLAGAQAGVSSGAGSNLLIGGAGNRAVFLEGASSGSASDTVVGFHPGDVLTVFGFNAGVSHYGWATTAGTSGYLGGTLVIDVSGQGHGSTSITFTGANAASTAAYSVHTGVIGGVGYLSLAA